MPLLGPDGNPMRTPPPDSGEPTEPIKVETAFLVLRLPDGSTVMHHDVNLPLTVGRPPTRDEVKGMCTNVIDDTNNSEVAMLTTQQVLGNLMQMGQQQAQRQLTPEEKAALAKQNGFPH